MIASCHTLIALLLTFSAMAEMTAAEPAPQETVKPAIAKKVLGADQAGENLLRPGDWRPYEKGFQRQGDWFVCDNGTDARARARRHPERRRSTRPARNRSSPPVGAGPKMLAAARIPTIRFISISFTPTARPSGGRRRISALRTHDWQRRQVVVLPEKPVKQLSFYMLLRGHAGKAWFRDAELRVVRPPAGACLFDGMPVVPHAAGRRRFPAS